MRVAEIPKGIRDTRAKLGFSLGLLGSFLNSC